MDWLYEEPRLEDVLSDPIVKAVMAVDGVEHRRLRTMLNDMGETLARQAKRAPIPSRSLRTRH
jgi:hypothetical protein